LIPKHFVTFKLIQFQNMKTITIDIISEKAIKLLQDLESLNLIRVRNEKNPSQTDVNWVSKYKGIMGKQSVSEIDTQLNNLRSEWE